MTTTLADNLKSNLKSIEGKYNILHQLVDGVCDGILTCLIIQGPPGIGKTYSVVEHIRSRYLQNPDKAVRVTRVSGYVTPLALFHTLMDHSDKGSVIVFDDCDSVWENPDSRNIMKSAIEPHGPRRVAWTSSKSHYRPFECMAGIIIITNADLKTIHWTALTDRAHVLDLKITTEEKIAKIYQVATNNSLVDPHTGFEIASWMVTRRELVNYLSIRTFVKIAQLARMSQENWHHLAEATILSEVRE